MDTRPLVRRVLIASAVLGAASAAVVGWQYGPRSALSSAVGSVIGVANFALLARLMATVLDEANPSRARAGAMLGFKFVGLVTLVGVLVVNGYVRGGSFMAGVSAVVLAITLAGLTAPADTDPTPPPPSTPPTDS
jgi:hypothetical protein